MNWPEVAYTVLSIAAGIAGVVAGHGVRKLKDASAPKPRKPRTPKAPSA